MALTEAELEILSLPPTDPETTRIQHTRDMIEEAIKDFYPKAQVEKSYNFASLDYKVYLQGSYKNSTNTKTNSDVDIVVELTSIFTYDMGKLPEFHKSYLQSQFSHTTYSFAQYKAHTLAALRQRFGISTVEEGNKSIKIRENYLRVNADVVPSFSHRHYLNNQSYIDGIALHATKEVDYRKIINFPKQHHLNSAAKNQATYERYKPMVRVFKNIRHKLIDKGLVTREEVPSYYIENLIYNVPNDKFVFSKSSTTAEILLYLSAALNGLSYNYMTCANGIDLLFGVHGWNLYNAQKFLLLASKYYLQQI